MNKNSKKIELLLAEDDIDDRFFFESAIKKLAIKTSLIIVKDGEELMGYLSKNTNNLPNILFLDLSMPRKTGFECLSEIKENPLLDALPIVLLSTSYSTDSVYENGIKKMLLGMGANEFIKKPDHIEQLKEAIENSLKKWVFESFIQLPQESKIAI